MTNTFEFSPSNSELVPDHLLGPVLLGHEMLKIITHEPVNWNSDIEIKLFDDSVESDD